MAPLTADVKRPAPAPQPVLKGIVHNGSTIAAIIEHNGHSGYYQSGGKVGGFTVQSISASGVVLMQNGKTITLTNGGKKP